MEAVAKTKYLKGSPRKTRLVIDMIRGENVSRALAILKFTDKRAADPIAQCLSSAIANATYKAEQQNIAIDPDDLWVKTCFVDMGPTKGRKRMRPAPQGRAYREQRHYCHITIHVTSEEQPKTEKELRAEAAKAKKAAEGGKAKPKKVKPAVKKAEKAKVEEVETVVETPVEAVAETAAAEVVETPVAEAAAPAAEENVAETTVENTEETSEETAKE
ncbi:MAG: 50S ribosomal protein L22 [Acidobacteria bacterium]|nr:50S ribosomal protein L22 [Acidobacteriota bacterium]